MGASVYLPFFPLSAWNFERAVAKREREELHCNSTCNGGARELPIEDVTMLLSGPALEQPPEVLLQVAVREGTFVAGRSAHSAPLQHCCQPGAVSRGRCAARLAV